MKKLSSIILMLCLCTALSLNAAAKELISDTIINETKLGVAMVVTENSTGSSVAIGIKGEPVQYFLTNCHCVAEDDWVTPSEGLSIAIGDVSNPNNCISAQIVYKSQDYDFAILKTESPVHEVVPQTIFTGAVHNGETIFAYGFSGESRLNGKIIATKDNLVYADGEITNLSYDVETSTPSGETHLTKDTYMTTMRLTSGYSGGPLFNSDGFVIGLNNGTRCIEYSDGTTEYTNSYAVKIDYILDVLDANNIAYESYSVSADAPDNDKLLFTEETENKIPEIKAETLPIAPTQKDNNLPLIIIISATALAIVAVLIRYALRIRAIDKEDAAQQAMVSTTAIQEPKQTPPIEVVPVHDPATHGNNAPTRLNITYLLTVEDRNNINLLSALLEDGCRYMLKLEGENIAEITINNSRLKITSFSDTKPTIVVDSVNKSGYQLLQGSSKEDDTFRIDVSKHIYLIDTDHHVSIKIKE